MLHKYAADAEIISDFLPDVEIAVDGEVLARRNEAASAWVDSYTGRRMGYFLPAPATATIKRLVGENRNFLRVPVYVPGTLSVAGIAPAAYYISDKNGWLYARDFNAETYDAYSDACANFWRARREYLVTARWGFETTPAEIIEAVKLTVAEWFGRGAGKLGDISPAGFFVKRDAPPTAKLILEPFIKGEFEID